eukprot:TRINITY_DN7996_c0_g1_i1.p1 TRINITY_DN7996_c0_g1~~TRINITY_DN7996_c0_g1_i1.p1  ORF type:complete len:1377 (+),score=256.11 TRINITY_DN7996_c0_g1_i1:28-4158(+)
MATKVRGYSSFSISTSTLQAACFHPVRPVLYFVLHNELCAYNLQTQCFSATTPIGAPGKKMKLFVSAGLPLLSLLVEDQVRVWNTTDMSLHQTIPLGVHLQGSSSAVGGFPTLSAMSSNSPTFAFVSEQQKAVLVIDLNSGAIKAKWDLGVKIATTLTFLNTHDQVCVGHQDGSVVIFNLSVKIMAALESSINEPVTSITVKESKNIIAASTTNHVLQWGPDKDFKNPTVLKLSPEQCPIQDIFFHSQLSEISCFSKSGAFTLLLCAIRKDNISFLQEIPSSFEPETGHRQVERVLYHHFQDLIFFSYKPDNSAYDPDSNLEAGKGNTSVIAESGNSEADALTNQRQSMASSVQSLSMDSATGASGIAGGAQVEGDVVSRMVDVELEGEFYKRMITDEDPFPHSFLHHFYSFQFQAARLLLPPVSPRHHSASFYASPDKQNGEFSFTFNSEFHYLSRGNLMAYAIAFNSCSLAKELSKWVEKGPIWPNRLLYSTANNAFLLFYDEHTQEPGTSNIIPGYVPISQKHTAVPFRHESCRATDAIWIGANDEYVAALSLKGDSLAITRSVDTLDVVSSKKTIRKQLPTKVRWIWKTPLNQGTTIMLFDATNYRIHLANLGSDAEFFSNSGSSSVQATVSTSSLSSGAGADVSFLPNKAYTLPDKSDILQVVWLYPGSRVQAHYQHDPTKLSKTYLVAVLTSLHILILDSSLSPIVVYPLTTDPRLSSPSPKVSDGYSGCPVVSSIFWVGYSLFFTTASSVYYITLRGQVRPLASLAAPRSVICDVLCDRIVVAYNKGPNVHTGIQSVSIFEPLLLGYLHSMSSLIPSSILEEEMDVIARSYSSAKASFDLIQELDVASYSSLAFSILMHNRSLQVSYPWLGFQLALRTLQFSAAYQLLKNKLDALGTKSDLRATVMEREEVIAFGKYLVEISLHYAQFQTAFNASLLIEDEALLAQTLILSRKAHSDHLSLDDIAQISRKLVEMHKKVITATVNSLDQSETNERKPTGSGSFAESTETHEETKTKSSSSTLCSSPSFETSNECAETAEEGSSLQALLELEDPFAVQEIAAKHFFDWPLTYVNMTTADAKMRYWHTTSDPKTKMLAKSFAYFGGQYTWANIPAINLKHSVNQLGFIQASIYRISSELQENGPSANLDASETISEDESADKNVIVEPPTEWVSPKSSDFSPVTLMKHGLVKFEKNELEPAAFSFAGCLDLLKARLDAVDAADEATIETIVKPLRFVAVYAFLTRIMIFVYANISDSSRQVEIAHLLAVAARLPLHQRHKAATVKLAMQKNKEIDNWGVAKEFAKIIPGSDSDKVLRSTNTSNAHPFSFKIDYMTLTEITGTPTQCPTCSSLFEQCTPPAATCSVCNSKLSL